MEDDHRRERPAGAVRERRSGSTTASGGSRPRSRTTRRCSAGGGDGYGRARAPARSPTCGASTASSTPGTCCRPSACRRSSCIRSTTPIGTSRRGSTSPTASPVRTSWSCRDRDHGWWVRPDQIGDTVEAFLTGIWERGEWQAPEPDRILATVLFTDIVGSTARLAELGDRRWRDLLTQHHARVRQQLARFRGREVDTAGDGFFASFDGPARAIRCASVDRRGRRRSRHRGPGGAPHGRVRAGRREGRRDRGAHRRPRGGGTPAPARWSSRARSGISWPARDSSSRSAAPPSSRGSRGHGSSSAWRRSDSGRSMLAAGGAAASHSGVAALSPRPRRSSRAS